LGTRIVLSVDGARYSGEEFGRVCIHAFAKRNFHATIGTRAPYYATL
jgi:hypothetical protein